MSGACTEAPTEDACQLLSVSVAEEEHASKTEQETKTEGQVPSEQPGPSSTSSSLAYLPSRTHLFTSFWKSHKIPVNYIPTHDTAPAVTVTCSDSMDMFARMVKRVTGAAPASSRAVAKRPSGAPQGGGPTKKAAAAGTAKSGGAAAAAAAAGAGAAGPSASAPAEKSGSAASAAPQARSTALQALPQPSGSVLSRPAAAAPAPPAAAAALAAALSQQGGGVLGGAPRRSFTQDELKAKSVRDLKELCKARGLLVSGNKDQLMSRIIEHQRKIKTAYKSS